MQRLSALRFRDYRIFLSGNFISLIGTWMQATAQGYLVYRLTDQPLYLGLLGFSAALPALLVTLPAGVLIDRFDKKTVVVAMQSIMLLQAFTLAALALSGHISIWHILALSFVLGAVNIIDTTARRAILNELVDRDAIPNAVSLNAVAYNTAHIVGPAITAPFLIFLRENGEGWAFFANGISYLFVIVSLLWIRPRKINASANPSGFSAKFNDGLRFVMKTPTVWMIIFLTGILGFFGLPSQQLFPVFAKDVLVSASNTSAGVATRNSLLFTFQGIGALVAAVSLAAVAVRRKGLLLGAGQIVFAGMLVAFSCCRSLPMALIIAIALGWGVVTQLVLSNALIQLIAPDDLRGRVISAYLWALSGVAPFGSLFIGWMAQSAGASTAVMIGGGVCLLFSLLFFLFTPKIRHLVV